MEAKFDFTYDLTELYKECLPKWDHYVLSYCVFGSKTTIYFLNCGERMNLVIVVYQKT